MEAFLAQIICVMSLFLLQVCTAIFKVFYQLAGITTINTSTGYEGDMLGFVLWGDTSPVVSVFINVFIISVGLTCIFLIVAIIKNMINNKQPMTNLLVKAGGSLLATLAVFLITVLGINICTIILQQVNQAFGMDTANEHNIAAIIINSCMQVEAGTVYGVTENVWWGTTTTYYNNWGSVDELIERLGKDGYNYGNIFSALSTEGSLFNMFPTGFEDGRSKFINTSAFNEWQCLITSIAVVVAMAICTLGLIKRLLDIAFLIIALPLVSSTMVLDDGAKMKLWRETMISKAVLAFGSVIMVNLFLVLAPVLAQIKYFNYSDGDSSLMQLNSAVQCLVLVGTAFCIPTGQTLFARLMGTSAEESREMMQALRTAKAGAMGVAGASLGAAGMAKRMAVGGTNKFGRSTNGLLGKPLSAAGNQAKSVASNITAPARGVASNVARHALPTSRQANLHQAYSAKYGTQALANADKWQLKDFKNSGGVKEYNAQQKADYKSHKADYKSHKKGE